MADVETLLGALPSFESRYIGVKETIHRFKSMWYNIDHMTEADGADCH